MNKCLESTYAWSLPYPSCLLYKKMVDNGNVKWKRVRNAVNVVFLFRLPCYCCTQQLFNPENVLISKFSVDGQTDREGELIS